MRHKTQPLADGLPDKINFRPNSYDWARLALIREHFDKGLSGEPSISDALRIALRHCELGIVKNPNLSEGGDPDGSGERAKAA